MPDGVIFSKGGMKGGKFVPAETEKSRKQKCPGRIAAGALQERAALAAISSSG